MPRAASLFGRILPPVIASFILSSQGITDLTRMTVVPSVRAMVPMAEKAEGVVVRVAVRLRTQCSLGYAAPTSLAD
jgi:hypothetical protein